MKKQLLKTTLSVLALPLLMGNAPAPWAPTSEIEKFAIDGVTYETYNDENVIKVNVKNQQENSFIRYCFIESEDFNSSSGYCMPDELIPYNSSKEVYFLADNFNNYDFSKFKFKCEGYNEYFNDLVKIKSVTNWSKTENFPSYNGGLYSYEFDFEYEPLKTFSNYYPIVKLNFNDSDHYFVSSYRIDGKIKNETYTSFSNFYFQSSEDIDIKNVKINEILLVKGNNYYDKGNRGHYDIGVIILIIVGIVGATIVLGGLVVGLIFLIKAIKKKNKNKK